ncbi:uncharacterized protein LOC144645531 [Oculina patagonica]
MDNTHNNHSKHTGATQQTTQHPGTDQHTMQYPGTNRHFSQYLATNPFSTQQIAMSHHSTQNANLSQLSPQHPGTTQHSTPHLGQTSQYTETSKFPGPPLYTPYLGVAEYPGTKPQFEERTPFTTCEGSQLEQTVTQLHSGIQFTGGNSLQALENNGALNSAFNDSKVVGKTACSSVQPQNSNVDQFGRPSIKESPLKRLQNKLPEKQTGWSFFGHFPFFRKDGKTEKSEPNRDEQNQQTERQKQAEETRQKEKERIAKSIHLKHLITSYVKVRTLKSLCRDFETPVFGDFPGNEGEKSIMRNLAHFLKEEIDKIKFVSTEERGKIIFENHDPVLLASFPVIAATISELEEKRAKLEEERKYFEKLQKDVKGFSGVLVKNINESVALKNDVEAYNTRLEKLKERQETERKSNETEPLQFDKEMEEIDKIHIHSLNENLRTLQEKIGKETQGFNEARKELKNLKERNESLRARISEVETKYNNLEILLSEPSGSSLHADTLHMKSQSNI